MEQCHKDRLVKLDFQPFEQLGLHLYIVGSMSCSSSYANDACFFGWVDTLNDLNSKENNSFFEEFDPKDPITVKGFIAWLKSNPVWVVTNKTIRYKEEFLAKYF